jgi:phosphohistidine phosphatase SixA
MKRASRGLASLVGKIDWLASSGLVRAEQTADILNAQFQIQNLEKWLELKPDSDPHALLERLRKKPKDSVGIVIGHEPHLSRFLAAALAPEKQDADEHPLISLKKGAAVLLELSPQKNFKSRPVATLHWILQPALLRRLAEI